MRTQIIQVPYDSGRKNYRMGRGPSWIVGHLQSENFLVDELQMHDLREAEIYTSFEVARQLAKKACDVVHSGRFPLVLAGGCMSSLGTLAGLGEQPAIIWLDAHADFNTPDITISGFLDGMALATSVGKCWGRMAATIPDFRPVPDRQVALVGARQFNVDERSLFSSSGVYLIEAQRIRHGDLRAELDPFLAKIQKYAKRAYLHIDFDVLDPIEARVNEFSAPGGLRLTDLIRAGCCRDHCLRSCV